jgi:hypothetical protein
MNKTYLLTAIAIFAIATAATTTAAFADSRTSGEKEADDQIHLNPGAPSLGSDQDIRFHEGICQGGSSGGACDLPFIGEPGGREALDGR